MERGGFRFRRTSVRDKWEKLLIRKGVKLYGTRWCSMCSKQKAVLCNVCCSWERFYVDCDSLRNVLECSNVKKIPSWRVAGKWYIGAQSETSLKQLVESTEQGIQRWDVAEFTRRHRRRGKWAKEEFADVVKRSIIKARATAAAPPPPVVHSSKASTIPESGDGLNYTEGFTGDNSAGGLIIFALTVAALTQENFQKLLQTIASNGAPIKLQKNSLSKARANSTDSHDENMESLKQDGQKFAAAAVNPETSELTVCKDENTLGLNHYTRLNNSVGRFSRSGRKPSLTARQHVSENGAREGEIIKRPDVVVDNEVSHLHRLLRLSEASGMRLRKSLDQFWKGLMQNLD